MRPREGHVGRWAQDLECAINSNPSRNAARAPCTRPETTAPDQKPLQSWPCALALWAQHAVPAPGSWLPLPNLTAQCREQTPSRAPTDHQAPLKLPTWGSWPPAASAPPTPRGSGSRVPACAAGCPLWDAPLSLSFAWLVPASPLAPAPSSLLLWKL